MLLLTLTVMCLSVNGLFSGLTVMPEAGRNNTIVMFFLQGKTTVGI